MSAQPIGKALEMRIRLMAHAVVGVWKPKKWEWWAGYDWHQGLHIEDSGENFVKYRRGGGSSPMIELTNVQPCRVRDAKESEPVELDSKVIDAASIESNNAGGSSNLPWQYTGEFEKTDTKGHSFEVGFEQAIRNCFTAGNDTTPVKNELEITLGFSQKNTDTEEEAERVNRVFAFSGETVPGEHERLTAWRKVTRMQSIVRGHGDYEHSFKIGKHWHGKWQGGNYQWDTFANFMRVIKGEAPLNYPLAKEFRNSRAPGWLIDRLEEPLDLPFTQKLEFDNATSIKLRKDLVGQE